MNYYNITKDDIKPIKGFEDYKIDVLGNVYSPRTGKVMKTYTDRKGYERIDLKVNGKRYRNKSIHRLVALTFIPNPKKLPQVNHKDENKLNNRVENLEWCDNKYNSNYGSRNEKIIISRREKYSKPVLQLNDKLEIIKEYRCVEDTKYNGFQPSNIRNVLAGKRKRANGYAWKYKEETV